MRAHSTHHDDCGCLSARKDAEIATLREALAKARDEKDAAVERAKEIDRMATEDCILLGDAQADLAKAREEIKRWEDKEVRRAVGCCGQEERAVRAERARDEALAQVDRIQAQAAGEKDRNYARLYQYRALIVRAAEALSNGVDPVEGSLNPLEALRFELEAALGSHWCTQRQVQAPGAMEECRVCQPPLLPSPYFARAIAAERARDEAVKASMELAEDLIEWGAHRPSCRDTLDCDCGFIHAQVRAAPWLTLAASTGDARRALGRTDGEGA